MKTKNILLSLLFLLTACGIQTSHTDYPILPKPTPTIDMGTVDMTPIPFVCSDTTRLDPSKSIMANGVQAYYDCKLDIYCSKYLGYCNPIFPPTADIVWATTKVDNPLFGIDPSKTDLIKLYYRNSYIAYAFGYYGLSPVGIVYGNEAIGGRIPDGYLGMDYNGTIITNIDLTKE